jgi:acetyl-CoA carboxylase carboxyl transferase subunit alpha
MGPSFMVMGRLRRECGGQPATGGVLDQPSRRALVSRRQRARQPPQVAFQRASDYAERIKSCSRRREPMHSYLEFEKGLAEIEGKAEELRAMARQDPLLKVEEQAASLDAKAAEMLVELYADLSPWRKCQVARHPQRPHALDVIRGLFTEYVPLAGDRGFSEDAAVVGGLARFKDRPVMVLGHEKGHDTRSRLKRNFGMARPEGYRKAVRLMDLADRMNLPLITLIDTPGAFPGKGAEERGQSEAIARSTEKCLQISVPLVSVVIGEGGSGGAVAFATADRVAMLQHSVYSVISPEGCASILWKNSDKMREAAEALRLTAQDLLKLGVCDRIIEEPTGGAQRDRTGSIARIGDAIGAMLAEVEGMTRPARLAARRKKILDMGRKGLA